MNSIQQGNRAYHERLVSGRVPGWRCHTADHGDWSNACDTRPHGREWWRYYFWTRTSNFRHPLRTGVGKGYLLHMRGERLPWYIQVAYRLQRFPPSYWRNPK